MIEINDLSHALGKKSILESINLVVPDSSILGIIGINGAGKSTLLRLLAGVYIPDRGSVTFDGESPQDATTRQNVFFLPDDPYYTSFTTPEKLFHFYKTFYPEIDYSTYTSLLSEYSIEPNGHIRNFSKGMRRQTFIALALAIKPKYLLLDEAFDGLDPLSRKIFKDAIITLVENEGTTVLISSHSLRELEDFCDRFILIDSKTIRHQGSIDEHIGKLCKFELAFFDEINESLFMPLPVVYLAIKGRFAQVVLEGDCIEMRSKLEVLSPAVIDEMPLDFEEVFIHDVEKNRGDKK